ncbi:hypothetical protein [Micromonospora palythoicola]|uniref:hypothetical protein n=1 Tax=Micromonospora palythoicola TaxID=3120507 RepID=UPI002FCE0647
MPEIETVTLCSSAKFYDTAQRAETAFRRLGMTVHTPSSQRSSPSGHWSTQ